VYHDCHETTHRTIVLMKNLDTVKSRLILNMAADVQELTHPDRETYETGFRLSEWKDIHLLPRAYLMNP